MRLFVALVPPEEFRRDLERQGRGLRALCQRGRMVPWENIHLTLAFLGETDRRAKAERAMERAAGAPFSLHITRPGRFSGKKGDLWWMGVEVCPPLLALRRRLVRSLGEEGMWLDDTKSFRPHLTLGRDLRPLPGADLTTWAAACTPGAWQTEELILMESRRDESGLRYRPLSRCSMEK